MRTYGVRIADSTQSPEELLAFVESNFNRATPVEVAEFTERRPRETGGGGVGVGDSNAWTLERIGADRGQDPDVDPPGHSGRAHGGGQIEFRTSWADSISTSNGGRDVIFEIYSVARGAGRAFSALYSYLPVAREMQLYMWVHFCLRVAEMAKGTVVGNPEVRTVRYES